MIRAGVIGLQAGVPGNVTNQFEDGIDGHRIVGLCQFGCHMMGRILPRRTCSKAPAGLFVFAFRKFQLNGNRPSGIKDVAGGVVDPDLRLISRH